MRRSSGSQAGRRSLSPARVSIEDIRVFLAGGDPVVTGLATYHLRGGSRWSYDERYQGPGGNKQGHAVTLVGFDDRSQRFKFINSWGTRWGENGFGFIDYELFPGRRRTRPERHAADSRRRARAGASPSRPAVSCTLSRAPASAFASSAGRPDRRPESGTSGGSCKIRGRASAATWPQSTTLRRSRTSPLDNRLERA